MRPCFSHFNLSMVKSYLSIVRSRCGYMNKKVEEEEDREYRIAMEAIVDCYGPEEQAMGWYYYLQDRMAFPFRARCEEERSISPLREGEEVEVVSMADEADCECEMFVRVEWMGRSLAVPLAQLVAIDVDEETEKAIGDWHYWVKRGYQLC
jgi:hypothetical protein